MDEKLLTPKEAGEALGIGVSGLNKRRMRGEGPPYVKLSPGP